ncbi:hypothetical protein OG625_38620 [Streptomyces sp. NBC_01351]|uniref:hypothetical protein n=1 Tax=Streptomyces sp. NBC_01351 TaxID=2903833 RepID=UPI002E2F3297|nr:hypothetical protein [Streptomyces sp. NBC_01351]
MLAEVLNTNDPVHVALRRQVPYLSVQGRYTCGCGTAYFELDTSEVEPAPTGPGTVVAAEAQLVTEAGECPGEALVFTQGGYMSWLEVCSWSDDIEVTLAGARHWLQLRHALDPNGRRPASDRMAPSLEPLCGTALRSGMDQVAARGGLGRAAQWGGWR